MAFEILMNIKTLIKKVIRIQNDKREYFFFVYEDFLICRRKRIIQTTSSDFIEVLTSLVSTWK